MLVTEDDTSPTVEAIFLRPAHLRWYNEKIAGAALDAKAAARDFIARAAVHDVTPVRFFDPLWYRENYPVNGANAFLDYLRDGRRRMARPSPLFEPRWYARRYGLAASERHPFLDYLSSDEERDPHPLLDVNYLRSQMPSWRTESVALEYLDDPEKFRLKPHPLFDAAWYLEQNPDVWEARMNPLEHYLRFGWMEGRRPNRLFNLHWYREAYQSSPRSFRTDPLTDYVKIGCARGRLPAPGLRALSKASIRKLPHAVETYRDAVKPLHDSHQRDWCAPYVDPIVLYKYLAASIVEYNSSFPPGALLLRRRQIAIMYSPKCASTRIVFWWLAQRDLLQTALKYSTWPHDFENAFRISDEFVLDALEFDPNCYKTYKFVRHPTTRAVSSFVHLLLHPYAYNFPKTEESLSFTEFLELLPNTKYLNYEPHFAPQQTKLEKENKLTPKILKIEADLDSHLQSIESTHALPHLELVSFKEVREVLQTHSNANGTLEAGPRDKIPFGKVPKYRNLLTPETIAKIAQIYACDFEAYGYDPEADF